MTDTTTTPKLKKGFACMTPERRAEISRKGGASVRPENRSFSRDNALAMTAGSLGGKASKRGPAKVEG